MCFRKDVDELQSQVADLTRKLTEDNAISLQLMNENARSKERLQVAEQKLAENGETLQTICPTRACWLSIA